MKDKEREAMERGGKKNEGEERWKMQVSLSACEFICEYQSGE